MNDLDILLPYFRTLAATSKAIAHTDEIPGIFEFNWDGFIQTKRKQPTILFLHPFQGGISGVSADNPLDAARVQWSILRQMKDNTPNDAQRMYRETKQVAISLLARMRWHQEEDPDGTYCDLLRYLNLDDVEYRLDEIYEDNWTGYRIITPLATELDLTMNPDDWTTP
jgi:hypothetical protein